MGSFPRFLLVGSVVLSLENITVFILMNHIDSYMVVRGIATSLALVQSYLINTVFSFSSRYNLRNFLSYILGVSGSLFISYLVSLGVFFLIFKSDHPLLSTNIGAVVAAITNYLYQRFITYAPGR